MVWTCFTGEKLEPLLVCNTGSVDGEAYSEILFDGLLSFVDDLLDVPDNAIIRVATANTLLFMHDNAPCHKSNNVRELLDETHIPVQGQHAPTWDRMSMRFPIGTRYPTVMWHHMMMWNGNPLG